ncbi:hypothetical protein FB567DRAFT_2510 [Paraphoma chrysanthemicola]|uniref:Uncharacterized protein n=1 Tax=Paraphoma chrysanthemicola TaxID=798071 RepID=A0A8K0RFJ5_9PLEO|nr:hypothetical protein FB567DRAFT_2510 [Paraphoma chrysanthemicola]
MLPISKSVQRDYFARTSTTAPSILKRDHAWTNSAKEFLADIRDDIALLKNDLALPPHFFELPREIRDEVYKYVWHDAILAFTDDDFIVVARGSRDLNQQPTTVLPNCTSVCRQMRIESIEYFHRTALFSVGEVQQLPAYIHQYLSKESGTMQTLLDDRIQPKLCYQQHEAVTVMTITELRRHPFNLRRSRHIHVSRFWWGAAVARCTGYLDISIYPRPDLDFGKLRSLLEREHEQHHYVALVVKPATFPWIPLFGGAFAETMVIRQDFTFMGTLPYYVREIHVDTGSCGWAYPDQPRNACEALALFRSKCEEFNESRRVP